MFIFRFALRNIRSRKSSLVIILFIAFAIAVLVVSNAIFDGTDNGIETTFINSFTGNVVIRAKAEFPLSLFGDETPVTGELSEIPPLIPYNELVDLVTHTAGVQSVIPQITGMAALNINGIYIPTALFGVSGDTYLQAMNAIRMVDGRVYATHERGMMISQQCIQRIKEATGVTLQVGDTVQLLTAGNFSFNIRAVELTGIYEYAVQNTVFDQIILVDGNTVRALVGAENASNDESTISEEEKNLIESDLDIDDFFSDAEDVFAENADTHAAAENAEKLFSQTEVSVPPSDSTVWSFLICKTDNTVSTAKLISQLNRTFKKNDWPVQAINWRTAAGGTVYLIFYLRVIFNIGIILILLTGFIVVTNTLTISALDRVQETGTLRALGANRTFVALQFLCETGILTISAGVLGCIVGVLINRMLCARGITISNHYLMQLFGGDTLSSVVTAKNIAHCMLISIALAFIGWFYPVHVALEANPIVAIRGGGK